MGNPLNLAKIDAEIAAQLDSKLGESSLSLRQLSEKSGVKLTRLGDVLRRGRPMTVGELEAISRTLGLIGWRVMRQAEDALEAEAHSNVLRFPATTRQENQAEADAMLAEQRYAASQLKTGEKDAPQYPDAD